MTSKDTNEENKHEKGYLKIREKYPMHTAYVCLCTYFIQRPCDSNIIRQLFKKYVNMKDHEGEKEEDMLIHLNKLTMVKEMEFNPRRYGR